MTMEHLQPFRSRWKEWLLATLLISVIFVWAVLLQDKEKNLKVYFLDIGQGDAILIETPSKKRVLIDGGRNRKVVSEIGKILPFGARRIDIVIATHPDADHIGGLPEVVSRYKVGMLFEPGVLEQNELNDELHERALKKGVTTTLARRGQIINFGDGTKLTILFPDRDVSNFETNDASIVARLDYGESSFLFTGDAGIKTENILITVDPKILDTDVLKAGHHGSRTSTSLSFAQAVTPEISIISAGKDNTYGHPHKEVLSILEKTGSEIVSTAVVGTIKLESDGITIKQSR